VPIVCRVDHWPVIENNAGRILERFDEMVAIQREAMVVGAPVCVGMVVKMVPSSQRRGCMRPQKNCCLATLAGADRVVSHETFHF
jgi:hypothetical protein